MYGTIQQPILTLSTIKFGPMNPQIGAQLELPAVSEPELSKLVNIVGG